MNSEPAGLEPDIVESFVPPHGRDTDAASDAACWLCVAMPLVEPDTACVIASVTSEVEISLFLLAVEVADVACLLHAVKMSAADRVKTDAAMVTFFIPVCYTIKVKLK